MYILKQKHKDCDVYYLCKSYRDPKTKKNSTKIIEKLGSEKDIRSKHGKNIKLDAWLKNYAKEKTKAEKENSDVVSVKFNSGRQISPSEKRIFHAGYLALQKICYELKIDKICEKICEMSGFKYNLTDILTSLIYDKIILADDENSYRSYLDMMIEQYNISKTQINKAIHILAEYSDYIQTELYKNTVKILNIDTSMVFNECINYCYDIFQYAQKSPQKKSKSTIDLVQLDIFYDKHGIPLRFINNSDEKKIKESHKQIVKWFEKYQGDTQIISFMDYLPSQTVKKINENFQNCYRIQNLNIKMLNRKLKGWILNKDNWNAWNSNKTYNLDDIENQINHPLIDVEKLNKLERIIFYKKLKLVKDDVGNSKYTQKHDNLLIGFSFYSKKEDRRIRNDRYGNMKQMLDKHIIETYKKDPEAFLKFNDKFKKFLRTNISSEGGSDTFAYNFNSDIIDEENIYDGFFACLSNSEICDDDQIIYHRFNTWLIDYLFASMKRQFGVIPDSISKQDAINAHLTISYISLLAAKIFQKKLKGRFSLWHLRDIMYHHNYIKVPGMGWIPTFIHNKAHQALDEIYGIKSDYEFISESTMKKIIKASRVKYTQSSKL